VSAGDLMHDRSDLLRLGYARVTDPDSAAAGWVPAFAIDGRSKCSVENPASLSAQHRCLDVIAGYASG
jgi:hypothetical protein